MTVSKTLVKICGITRLEDAILSSQLGAWALGFILWPQSRRFVSVADAAQIVQGLKSRNLCPTKIVGVFVNQSVEDITAAVKEIGLTTVQLHGDESAEFGNSLPYEVFRSIKLRTSQDLSHLAQHHPRAFLIDAVVEGAYGGTGQTCDWELARQAKASGPIILSGGLNPQNIKSAVLEVAPFALDLASGVESSPGIKSQALLEQLFKALR